jgi:glycosyltransferase involved in cell wall biosynthesis/O-antigen/teichoic acid export membrane protein
LAGVRRSSATAWGALSSSPLRAFWRQTGLLLGVLAVVNGSNYLFHVVISRMLGPSDYGALAALLAVVLVLSVPFGVIQTAIAHRTAALRSTGRADELDALGASALKTTTPLAWAAGIAVAVLVSPLLSHFLHVDLVAALLLAPYVVASVPASVAQGVLQGEHRFAALAGVQVVGTLLRLALGVGLVAGGLGVTGAVLATVLSAALTVPIAFLTLHIGRATWRAAHRSLSTLRGNVAPALYGLTSFWVLAEADIVLARHFLEADAAGFYSSAGLIARALLFVPAAVGVVAFPRFVAARGDVDAQMWWLRASVIAIGCLTGVGFVFLFVLREPLITFAFGSEFAPAASVLPILAVAMSWLAVVSVLVYFQIALASRAYVISLAGVAAETVLIAIFHADAEQVALVVGITCAAVAFFHYQAAASICRWQAARPGWRQRSAAPLVQPATLDLSVVLPCHNAASGIRTTALGLLDQLESVGSFELIVVSDGSTDRTVEIARSLEPRGVRVIEYPLREGKGHALNVGLSEARGRYIAFCDADGDIAADALTPFLTLMRLYEPDVVLGSKRHPLSEVYYPPLRRVLSWIYHKITRVLFRVNVRDTQTGFKLIRRDVLAAVLPRLFEKRYAFDLEFLVVARSLGFKRVLEAPVRIEYQFASQVSVGASARILTDTLAIFYRHYILNSYRGEDVLDEGDEALEAQTIALDSGPARVLFINWRDVDNPDAGGAETFTHEVAKRWAAQGHDVTELASSFDGAQTTTELDGVRIRRVGRLRTGSFHLGVQRELARLRGFDLVVESVNTLPFLTPLWKRRLPRVITLFHQLADDVWDAELPAPLAFVGRRIERALLGLYRGETVVAVSPSTRDDLVRLGFTNVDVVHNGRDEPPDVSGIAKEREPTFLFVGRLAANKRPDHAVAAFESIRRSLPASRLWLVGAGPMEAELARTLPVGAELLGRLSREELYERMARAQCLLVPSVREGWGLVVIEANSVGTPAVGYDIAGLRDSIRHGETGLLAAAGNADELAGQALSLVTDPQRYEDLRRAAVDWAERFSWDATAARLAEVAGAQRDARAEALVPSLVGQGGAE